MKIRANSKKLSLIDVTNSQVVCAKRHSVVSGWASTLLLLAMLLGSMALLGASGDHDSQGDQAGVVTDLAGTQTRKTDSSHPPSPTDPRPADYETWQTIEPGQYLAYNQRASLLQRGKAVYAKYCIGCHGAEGDGLGPAATRLLTKPRDFTQGIYKFRSTDSGSLPLEADLYRTITNGLSRVSMPAFPQMPQQEKVAVIEYIKSFYPDWEKQKDQRKVVSVPAAPVDLHEPDRIFRGRIVYLAMQCGKCHGSDGAGSGATQTEYTDAWGNPQKPLNFTRGQLKGGDNPEDIFRTFHTGLRSVMPAYGGVTLAAVNVETFETQKVFLQEGELEKLQSHLESFPATAGEVFTQMDEGQRRQLIDRNSWDLVAYVMSLQQEISTARAVLGSAVTQVRNETNSAEPTTSTLP